MMTILDAGAGLAGDDSLSNAAEYTAPPPRGQARDAPRAPAARREHHARTTRIPQTALRGKGVAEGVGLS